jgi:hypothetical protein
VVANGRVIWERKGFFLAGLGVHASPRRRANPMRVQVGIGTPSLVPTFLMSAVGNKAIQLTSRTDKMVQVRLQRGKQLFIAYT